MVGVGTSTSKTLLGVGIIGCGNISDTYFRLIPLFRSIEARACADINPDAAQKKAQIYGLRALTTEQLLSDPQIDIVVNLTTPDQHFSVTSACLRAGKHVWSEKPFVLELEHGRLLQELAKKHGVHIGSAPDTFLGGALQIARAKIDSGAIGQVTSGTCAVMNHGMESWHPNPDFFFKPGGGPVLDLGPYYISALVHLLGPVKSVAARATKGSDHRVIASGPRTGEKLNVDVNTTYHALLAFENGSIISFIASWDVWAHRHTHIELYGTKATMIAPDPNFFGGDIEIVDGDGQSTITTSDDHPLGKPNDPHADKIHANYRSVGLADMAEGILTGQGYRCAMDRALHGVDVMLAIDESSRNESVISMRTTCTRPEALDSARAKQFFR